jgi:uncharacterized membrane protein
MDEKRIHRLFEVSVTLKGVHALFEIASGLLLYLVGTATIVRLIDRLVQAELIEDPQDFLARHAIRLAEGLSIEAHNFYAFYLLSHGIVKAVLVVALLREKLWAYPASFVVFGAFIAYQLYRYRVTHAIALMLLTAFDLLLIVLVWHEYRLVRHHLPTR